MSGYLTGILLGAGLLAAPVPYVRYIRHPQQKLLAAYLIFVSVFIAIAVVLFRLLVWLAEKSGQGDLLGNPDVVLLLIVLVLLPAVGIATWQARKSPWRQGPPD